MTHYSSDLESPVGTIKLLAQEDALTHILWPTHKHAPSLTTTDAPEHPVLQQAAAELAAYFTGERKSFSVPIAPQGTAFQQEVWAALREIPWGETCSYAALAQAIGRPKAVRAVGAANGRNPLSIIVPCHRVIGSKGTLTGYAGGVETKAWLLQHEQSERPQQPSAQLPLLP